MHVDSKTDSQAHDEILQNLIAWFVESPLIFISIRAIPGNSDHQQIRLSRV